MTEYFQYYRESLYPMQDKILSILRNCGSPFYLTGETALSRGYYQHRFSDDLDFFVNGSKTFYSDIEKLLPLIEKDGFVISKDDNYSSPDFLRLSVANENFPANRLKIDFVNDVPVHFCDYVDTSVYYKTDSIENILTNKYTALY